jgi:glutathione-specific gamma-glutamylcyclotransferase
MDVSHDLWVFAYGSLMWRPGFRHIELRHARLTGYRRCFCIYSIYHRGTMARPGLVLGLDRGGACEGIAYRVAAADASETVRYLRAREQVNGVYREARLMVELMGEVRQEVMALTYIVERAHPSYAGRLPPAQEARLIRGASGRSGNNLDYLIATLRHLDELGIRERGLARLLALIGPHAARCGRKGHASPYVAGLLRVARRQPAPRRNLRLGDPRRFLYRQRLQ